MADKSNKAENVKKREKGKPLTDSDLEGIQGGTQNVPDKTVVPTSPGRLTWAPPQDPDLPSK